MIPALAAALDAATKPVSSVFVISLYSFSRVLLRHPNLRLVLAESALSWGMLYLEWPYHQFEHDGLAREGYDLTPLQMFKRQCFFNPGTIPSHPSPITSAPSIFSVSQSPACEFDLARTRETIDHCFKGLSAEARERCCGETRRSCIGCRMGNLSGGTRAPALPLESLGSRCSKSSGPLTNEY